MFCPDCKSLCFPDMNDNIQCVRYRCGYTGPTQNLIIMPDRGLVNLGIPVAGWSISKITICRGLGCSSSVYLGRNFCATCHNNSGMMPGAYYRAWSY